MGELRISGRCSTFGGPDDSGMTPDEGLALYWTHDQCDERPHLFLPRTPENERLGTSKRLDPDANYIAIRFNKAERSIQAWRNSQFRVSNPANGHFQIARLTDWGPNVATGRAVDLSPALARLLGVSTDDTVEVLEL